MNLDKIITGDNDKKSSLKDKIKFISKLFEEVSETHDFMEQHESDPPYWPALCVSAYRNLLPHIGEYAQATRAALPYITVKNRSYLLERFLDETDLKENNELLALCATAAENAPISKKKPTATNTQDMDYCI